MIYLDMIRIRVIFNGGDIRYSNSFQEFRLWMMIVSMPVNYDF
jgi:hypothetical protein